MDRYLYLQHQKKWADGREAMHLFCKQDYAVRVGTCPQKYGKNNINYKSRNFL